MRVRVVPCGPAANRSERTAVERLKSGLISTRGGREWVLLTNLSFSVTHQLQSDEIDIVAIGPPGVQVIEVKHWTEQWMNKFPDLVEQEADKLTRKSRKVGTTLRRIVPSLDFVDGAFLITREQSTESRPLSEKAVRGVKFHSLKQWQTVLGLGLPDRLTHDQVHALAKALMPNRPAALDSSPQRFAGYIKLKPQTPKEELHHRVYKGLYARRQESAILHVYDLSAGNKDLEKRASREFDALQRLQRYSWVPRILETYQEAPGYEGEMFFFSVADTAAPSIEERANDSSWDPTLRLSFARRGVQALSELHEEKTDGRAMVHRNLTPETILVKHDNSPILTGFQFARNPTDVTIASLRIPCDRWNSMVAPEVRTGGLGASDQRSDVYSLCVSLNVLFEGREDERSIAARDVLAQGAVQNPTARLRLHDLEVSLAELIGEQVPTPPAPPSRYWTEEQIVRFRDRDYRIVTKLGSGGIGTAFKVIEIDQSMQLEQEIGSYVAKVVYDKQAGKQALSSHRLARPHLGGQPSLSTIFEVAPEWRDNEFIALMKWIEGSSLHEFIGVFELLAEDWNEPSAERLALRWLRTMCEALDTLHRNHLVHGDVSPRNIIVSEAGLVLTDYDCVCPIGQPLNCPGTVLYSAPPGQDRRASPSDDIYALAASFYHVFFDREPFLHDGSLAKERGLNWPRDDDSHAILREFLDKATDPDPARRYPSASAALEALSSESHERHPSGTNGIQKESKDPTRPDTAVTEGTDRVARSPKQVDWLRSLLQSYPGSHWGNRETRGLDSAFAAQTYVETEFEAALYQDIRARRVRLAVLCGNAGDGKTALLQHLAEKLGIEQRTSSKRVLEGRTSDGLRVRMNLDGSASWQGQSADELLDDFLEPFQQGPPNEDMAHLLAINDGRLLEWAEEAKTPLSESLIDLLDGKPAGVNSHIRFVSLNQRSLVGNVTADKSQIETGFLERLLDRLYGGDNASEIWSPCRTCSAQDHCEVLRAGRIFGPGSVPGAMPERNRNRARHRLFEALQAVHLRGETHITVRELRAAVIYILFGVHFCTEYHDGVDAPAYWNRAFSATSVGRQGETLSEFLRFDPALEAHPKIDRHLLNELPADHGVRSLGPARRRAYFEWMEPKINEVGGDPNALGLAQGRHLSLFRDLPLRDAATGIDEILEKVCRGVSHLGDLPSQSIDRRGTPLRIPPRTPTETKFWVKKPLDRFSLYADLPPSSEGLDRLHRHAILVYRYRDGKKERLSLGADLFHWLLELSDGYQLGDVSADDTFARLSIFVQRLLREDDREMFAWNPSQDEMTYRLWVEIESNGNDQRQLIKIAQWNEGVPE